MVSTSTDDLAARVLSAGGVTPYLNSTIRDTVSFPSLSLPHVSSPFPSRLPFTLYSCIHTASSNQRLSRHQSSLREIHQVANVCEAELSNFSKRSVKADGQLRSAAQRSLHDARARLEEIRSRAKEALAEHNEKSKELQSVLKAFEELEEARLELGAVSACRAVAEAYIKALRPLVLHQKDGSVSEMDEVAGNVGELITTVDKVRKRGKSLFGNDGVGERVVKSVENRVVDAVIRARAVFVNVLDNEFRAFGWPMKVPMPGGDDNVIKAVNFYANQMSLLQKVASDADYVSERTRWHRGLSDSWAIAAILRAPLARFKYHFLESFRPDSESVGERGTSRFDRPEWAAEFALERIREATPFLTKVMIDGPATADVKFAEGFCRVFAEKIAYDCELALRTSTNDADADILIAHASETAKQFDTKLRSGIIAVDEREAEDVGPPVFMSSLHILSMNESFLTTWASSELRLADAEVNRLLCRALMVSDGRGEKAMGAGEDTAIQSRSDLELLCLEIVEHVGNASEKCRVLESDERIATFLKLTELPLLQSLRARLKEEVDSVDDLSPTPEQVLKGGRASFCAQLISDCLEDRSIDGFYMQREKALGRGFYDDEIARLRGMHSSNCTMLCEAITGGFIDSVKTGYMHQARFGEISAPDAAVVLTHDLSDSLVAPLTTLENLLNGISRGIPCRKTASTIWRPVASKIDRFFFDEVVLQCFAGGSRNAMSVASATNSYLVPVACAKMGRQLAFDASILVSTFNVVSMNPGQFLPLLADCGKVLRVASGRVLLPSAPPREEEEEVIEALRTLVDSDDDEVLRMASRVLEARIGVQNIGPREALELLAIGGMMKIAIRMM